MIVSCLSHFPLTWHQKWTLPTSLCFVHICFCHSDYEMLKCSEIIIPSGYPKFSTFGATVGSRSMQGRKEFVNYYKNAISVPGPEITEIETISREEKIFIVTGFIEKDNGTLYCSVGFFHPEKGLLYKRRKVSFNMCMSQNKMSSYHTRRGLLD